MKIESLKLILNKDTLLTFILIIYFCGMPISSALTLFFSRDVSNFIVSIVLFLCILIFCINCEIRNSSVLVKISNHMNRYDKKYNTVFMVYFLITITILLTVMIHPEYKAWYNHDFYGITAMFLSFKGGIWAFLIISLYKDDDKLLQDLKKVTVFVFLLYFGKFIVAMYRGYWVIETLSGYVSFEKYNMEFGFRMLFVVAFWGAQAFLNNDKKYLVLYIIGILIILLGGSRAPVIWALSVLVLIIPFKYKNSTNNQKAIIKIAFLLGTFFLFNAEKILIIAGSFLIDLGLSSRTVVAFSQGTFLNANGRDIIYSMAVELIKNGGLWGYGFYGDRYYIGEYFVWGYAHNIFLELLITLGPVIGSIVIVLFVSKIIKLYKIANTTNRQIVVITFLATSLKLLFSSSFWYEPSFWALMALAFTWTNSMKKVLESQ